MSGLIDFLMSEESWNPVVGVSVHFIEFENVSLLKPVDQIASSIAAGIKRRLRLLEGGGTIKQ